LDAELGSGTTLNLGTTTGLKFEINAQFEIKRNLYFTAGYRYQEWHINRSDPGYIIYEGTKVQVVEPESYTTNRYLKAGVLFRY